MSSVRTCDLWWPIFAAVWTCTGMPSAPSRRQNVKSSPTGSVLFCVSWKNGNAALKPCSAIAASTLRWISRNAAPVAATCTTESRG